MVGLKQLMQINTILDMQRHAPRKEEVVNTRLSAAFSQKNTTKLRVHLVGCFISTLYCLCSTFGDVRNRKKIGDTEQPVH